MSDTLPIGWAPGLGLSYAAPRSPIPQKVSFDRRELNLILSLYSRMVAAGAWRDYAIGFGREAAVFAIFRRTSERPLYRIEKRPKLRHRQGAFAVVTAAGFVMKRGHRLDQVLSVLDKACLALVE